MIGRPTGRLFSGCRVVSFNIGLSIVKALFKPISSGVVTALSGFAVFFPYARYGMARPAFVADYISTLFYVALTVFAFSMWVYAILLWWRGPKRWLRRWRARRDAALLLQRLTPEELSFLHAWTEAGLCPLQLDAGHPLVLSLLSKQAITVAKGVYRYGGYPHLGWISLADTLSKNIDHMFPQGYRGYKADLDAVQLVRIGQHGA